LHSIITLTYVMKQFILLTLLLSLGKFVHPNNNMQAFVPNLGQFVGSHQESIPFVLAKSSANNIDIYLTQQGISYVFLQQQAINKDQDPLHNPFIQESKIPDLNFARADMYLIGANLSKVNIQYKDAQITKYNYYYAHCPNGIEQVSSYKKITFSEVYPHIDWVIYFDTEGHLKYDFIVKPGGNPNLIKWYYKWADVSQSSTEIKFTTPLGYVIENTPKAYTGSNPVAVTYQKQDSIFSFNLASYNTAETLTIDPPLTWSTYYGGSSTEQFNNIDADELCNVVMIGYTQSTDFPTLNPGGGAYFQGTLSGTSDALIVKFDFNATRLWSTYYGGSGIEGSNYYGFDITTDRLNNIIALIPTNSTNMPVQNAGGGAYYQATNAGGDDMGVIKFNSAGVRIHGTYLGGTGADSGYAYGASICTDNANNVFVVGHTSSTNFPVFNPGGGVYFQGTNGGGQDMVIVKFSATMAMAWSTYYGGSSTENWGIGADTDASGNLFIGGFTNSTNFPTQNPGGGAYFQGTNGGSGDFVFLKFDNAGVRQWSTYYGGSANEFIGMSVSVDGNNNLCAVGLTQGASTVPTFNPGGGAFFAGTQYDMTDYFLLRFSNTGVRLWATYYGGNSTEHCGVGIATDFAGNIYIAGGSDSNASVPLFNPGGGTYYQAATAGPGDYLLASFSATNVMTWSTYFGGTGHDHMFTSGNFAVCDASGNFYACLHGTSTNIPTVNPGGTAYFDGTANGGDDGYLLKVGNAPPCGPLPLQKFVLYGISKDNAHVLSWDIEHNAEINYFVVEKIKNNVPQKLSQVLYNGNNQYAFTTQDIQYGTNLYRIQAISKDGRVAYSNTIELEYRPKSNGEMWVYPNPIKDRCNITLSSIYTGTVNCTLLDSKGSVVEYQTAYTNNGKFSVQFTEKTTRGTYLLYVITSSGQVYYSPVVIQ
jgi:hypothetical protein